MGFAVGLVSAASLRAKRARENFLRSGMRGTRAAVSGTGLLCVCAAMTALPHSARAQDNAKESGKDSSDVAQLILDLDDIDSMRPLIPLKLTPEQMDKMIAVISSEQTNYDRKLKAIAGPALAKLADQIHDVKQKTVRGEAIPKEFDALARQAQTEILNKRKVLDADTLAVIAASLSETLTPDQVKIAAKLDKDAQIKLGKAAANSQRTETQWFVSYVTDAVITAPRIVIVLKQMRAAANPKTAAAGK